MTPFETNLHARDQEVLLHPVTSLVELRRSGPFMVERGKGVHVWDSDGKRYIEGLAGLWCTALGHGVEELADAAREQMKKLAYSHLYVGRSHEAAVLLADRLVDMAPFPVSRVFFGTSGSDANDTQIKLIWYYNNVLGRPRKKKIISRLKAYHGSTIASGSLSGLPVFHKLFDLPIANVLHTACPHYYWGAEPGETEEEFATRLAAGLEQLIVDEGPDTVAAFIAEPVMGAGGVIVPPRTYFEKVQAVLKKYDVLLIDDEVICGFGRTGNVFGAETVAMQPDTITLAKALSSAYLPISAVLIPEPMYEVLEQGSDSIGVFGHGYTYTGHPVGAAVALKALELYEQRDIFRHARRVGLEFQSRLSRLAEFPLVGEARGAGLIGAVEFVRDKANRKAFSPRDGVGRYCAERCLAHGLIVRQINDTIALCPPLVVSSDDVNEIFDILERSVKETLDWARANGLLD